MDRGQLPALRSSSLDAVVIDTETTGLDPRKARVIELAGGAPRRAASSTGDVASVNCCGPAVNRSPPWRRAIHGIDDAMVAGAPPLRRSGRDFTAFLGHAIVIGHTVGFDLAVLKRECELAGLPWTRPRMLDTRLLAQIAAPELAGYTLENLAAWLGVELADRHSALGDAMTTARVFLALVPKLRDHGIRTHCRGRTGLPRAHCRARRAGSRPAGSRPSNRRRAPMPSGR